MAKRVYADKQYLIIAENLDLTDDKQTPLINVHVEKTGTQFTFSKITNDAIIDDILFADILDSDGNAYADITTFFDLMKQKTGVPGTQDVLLQDNDSPDISLYLGELLDTATVLTGVTIDDESIDIETTGVTPVATNFIFLREGIHYYQAEIDTVTPIAGNQYTLDVAMPFDFAFTTSATVDLQNVDMDVNGSSTPVEFELTAKDNDLFAFDITRMMISMVLATAGDDGLFGDLAALTNGTYFRVDNGITNNLYNAKDNSDFAQEGFDATYVSRSGGGGSFGMRARITFNGGDKRGVVKRLKFATSDKFTGTVRDNLTTLNKFRVKLQGQVAIE